MKVLKNRAWKLHLGIVIGGLFFDQITKIVAVAKFSLPNGSIDYQKVQQVIGELVQFRLVYNPGAAFGMQPQKIMPFLHPTIFYSAISLIALSVLIIFYLKIPLKDKWTQIGVAMITSGAFGNLTDRLRIHKVVDFIDVDFPNIAIDAFTFFNMQFNGFYMDRWPTFNIADSLVCVGVCIIFVVSFKNKKELQKQIPLS